MPASIEPQWKREAIVAALVGAAAMAIVYGVVQELSEVGSHQLPWGMEEALTFTCVLSVPGLITAGLVSMLGHGMPPRGTPEVLAVVINAAIYSASWVLVRRGGPGAGLRRFLVATPWALYAGFALLMASSTSRWRSD